MNNKTSEIILATRLEYNILEIQISLSWKANGGSFKFHKSATPILYVLQKETTPKQNSIITLYT